MAKGSAFSKELKCSSELREFSGKKKLARGAAVKTIWDHIKKKKLQNKDDKRVVDCDSKLEELFGKAIQKKRKIEMRGKTIKVRPGQFFMTELGGLLKKHLKSEKE